jgi:hypothetical protein
MIVAMIVIIDISSLTSHHWHLIIDISSRLIVAEATNSLPHLLPSISSRNVPETSDFFCGSKMHKLMYTVMTIGMFTNQSNDDHFGYLIILNHINIIFCDIDNIDWWSCMQELPLWVSSNLGVKWFWGMAMCSEFTRLSKWSAKVVCWLHGWWSASHSANTVKGFTV